MVKTFKGWGRSAFAGTKKTKTKGTDYDLEKKLKKDIADAQDKEDKHMREETLNELHGKGSIKALRDKAVAASNKAFWHGNKMKTGEIKAAHAAAGQAERLHMATTKEVRGRKFWLKQAKKKGDQKRTWRKRLKEAVDVTLSGKNSIEADVSKKQETWKMNAELKKAIETAIKASRAQIISTYGKPIHPGKVNPCLSEAKTKMKHVKAKGDETKAYSIRSGNKSVRIAKWKDKSWVTSSNYGHEENDGEDFKKGSKVTSNARRAIKRSISAARDQLDSD